MATPLAEILPRAVHHQVAPSMCLSIYTEALILPIMATDMQGVGLVGPMWLPKVLYALPMPPNDHPSLAQGSPGVVEVTQMSRFFKVPIPP